VSLLETPAGRVGLTAGLAAQAHLKNIESRQKPSGKSSAAEQRENVLRHLLATPANTAYYLSRKQWLVPPHLRYISDEITKAVLSGNGRLLIMVPPRHGKSELVSKYLPSWFLGNWPNKRIILTGYNDSFASQWGAKSRAIIDQFGSTLGFEIPGRGTASWVTDKGGGMLCRGVGGSMTGYGADLIVIDDPIKNRQMAESVTIRESMWEWYVSTLRTRLEPNGTIIGIMTRWHEDDLFGLMVKNGVEEGGDEWKVIRLPAISEDEDDELGRPIGEALWPLRYNAEQLARMEKTVGPYTWNGLFQQRPSALEGNMFLRTWWKFWSDDVRNRSGQPGGLPRKFDEVITSWDCTFKDTSKSDYVVGQVWGRAGASKYLLHQVRARMNYVDTERAFLDVIAWCAQHQLSLHANYVEEAANGPALMSRLSNKVPRIVGVPPTGSKVARAAAAQPEMAAGNVFLPDSRIAAWVPHYIQEHSDFPNGSHDDTVDATTQALAKMERGFTREIVTN
jgi:predicted phage terminase large subunit-like protein